LPIPQALLKVISSLTAHHHHNCSDKSSTKRKNTVIIFSKEKPKKRKLTFKWKAAKMQGRRGTSRLYTLDFLSAWNLFLHFFLLVLYLVLIFY